MRRWLTRQTLTVIALATILGIVAWGAFSAPGPQRGGQGTGYGYGGNQKQPVCHKGKKTLLVNSNAVEKHLRHGDTLGPCPARR